uniref:Thyroglobulin n=1 Tax=Sparus aurata TaxID=8175 RepID=A0A671TWW4_SPAAU
MMSLFTDDITVFGCCPEYQLESESLSQCELLRGVAVAKQQGDTPHCMEDGRFRPVQCSGRGQECWCVDAEGREVVGTRSNASAPHCASPCRLQSVLQCSPSGLFESVQCDSSRGQCWCVDHDGMELYGTRQTGTPPRCPGSCEVRSRRLLHSSASHSPPQCDDDGSFLPVQCRFINMTDRRELDLLHAFNRFPEAFETFSSFRKFFPMVSSYCFCSDSRGRELENTGVELLLSEVYDSAFSGLRSGRSVSQTNIYRVLQRRMLGVRLALTGHFRCPSPCEEERRATMEASSVFVPSCDSRGSFTSRQCQQGGQCWCVDPTGSELPGTRQHGDSLVCLDCPSQRRLALSRLFSGPIDLSFRASSGGSLASCLPLLRPLSEFLPVEADPTSLLSHLVEVLQGLFPSVGGALEALARSSPPRLQENLFGGKFLKNAASFNFSGAVGTQGALGVDRLSSQRVSLQKNRDLVQSVSRALEDPAFLSALQHTLRGLSRSQSLDQVLTPLLRSCSGDQEDDAAAIFVPRCTSSGGFQEVQCRGEECWCVDPRGQEVSGSRTAGRQPQCPSRCERQRAMALKVKGNMAAGAVIHIPACSEDGDFLPLQCVGARCFCVDAEGKTMTAGSAGGAVTCKISHKQADTETFHSFDVHNITFTLHDNHRQTEGNNCVSVVFQVQRERLRSFSPLQALAEVTAFRQEVKSIIALSNSTHLPLGYGFLLAEGLRLTPEELQTSQSEEELQISDRLLSRSKAALRLAAFSTVQMFLPPQRRSYEPFTPQCDADGHWLHTQCYHSTGQCWCVDEDGEYIPDSLTSRSLQLPKCRSVSLCDDSSVRLQCVGDNMLQLTVTLTAHLSDLPTSDLPDLHDVGKLVGGVRGLLGNVRSVLTSEPDLSQLTDWFRVSVSVFTVVCPAGSFSREGACLLCPQGTYQDEEGRDFCNQCPRGSSPAGASSVNQCVTRCQRRGLRCSEQGDFLPAQPDFLSGMWRCVTSEGEELDWTNSDKPLTDEECSGEDSAANQEVRGLSVFPVSLSACAAEPTCHHVASTGHQEERYGNHSNHMRDIKKMTNRHSSQFSPTSVCVCVCVCVRVCSGAEFSSRQQQSFERMTMLKAVSGVFRTQVFSSTRTSLSDAHRFCQDGCSRDTCCDGFILNQNSLNGGSLLCGWLRAPSVLMCGDQDWDVTGQGTANRICGAGLTYNEQQKSFVFNFGGQKFTISKKSNDQLSVQQQFESLSEDDVLVDPQRKLLSLSFWLNKKNYNSQQALLWCLSRCDEEPLCSIADLRDADSAGFFSCSLFPDTRVCGAYDKPLRRPCRPLLDRTPSNTHSKKVSLSGPVKSFYERVSFQKMVSYSVRSRVSLGENTPLSEGFMDCERRCDEDPCCRGIGFVRDTKSADVVCLSLISLGVQTCGEDDLTSWRTQDCSPSVVKTTPEPFGWYQKPGTAYKYTHTVQIHSWTLLSDSSVLVDPSVSMFDVIHLSRDITSDRDKTRNWCLHERLPTVTSVSIPGHGMLQGVAMETALGSDRKTVVQFLGVPYAHPPIGSLRFEAAQPADWTGTWDASKPRPSCIQPGDVESAASSEDCLYLNIFTPAALVILVFFFNPSANQSPGLLDGSTLAAAGHIVVVTASYRTAALGFLSTGSPGLPGNYGLSDQEAVLRWVNAHISLVGGDNSRVTVGAERRGADITSLHLSSSSSPLFQRMMLMGGSVFSPSLLQTPSISRQQAVDLARELGCDLTDLDKMAACLRATPVHTLNAAQTKLLAVSGPFQSWSPVRQSDSQSFHRVDLLQGTSEHDGLIDRARRIKDFEALQGRADGKTAFYEALSRSLGGATGSDVLKEAAAWFYSLDHSPSAAGYNLFSRALNNATRDLFIICPSLQMVSHWANSKANVFLYHQPASSAHDRADVSVPLDVQFVFGTPHHPMSSQRFTPSDRRLSLAMMTYVSSFIRTGDPNPSRMWAESVLPRWQQVQSSDAPPTYLELSPALRHRQGLSQNSCSFWNQLGTKLTRLRGEKSPAESSRVQKSPAESSRVQ